MITLRFILSFATAFTLNFELCWSMCAHAEYEVNGECCPMCAPVSYGECLSFGLLLRQEQHTHVSWCSHVQHRPITSRHSDVEPRSPALRLLCEECRRLTGKRRNGNCVYWDCTIDTNTTCIQCPPSTYTDEPNNLNKCISCIVCDAGQGLRVKRSCTRSADTVCEPLEGFYCLEQNKGSCKSAVKHSECSPGQYIRQAGTASSDTDCGNCAEGTYSNGSFTTCQPHSKCETEGLPEIKPGTLSSNAECGSSNKTLIGIIAGVSAGFVVLVSAGIFIFFKLKHKKQTNEQTNDNYHPLSVQESGSMPSQCDSEPTSVTPLTSFSKSNDDSF